MKTTVYKRVSESNGGTIPELIENISKAVKQIEKENPNWKEDNNFWEVCADDGDNDLILYYQREETPEEMERRERYVNRAIEAEHETLRRLMEKYPEEVQKNLK